MSMSNSEIRSSLLIIYDKLSKPSTREVAYELYKKLILKNIYYPPQSNYIIQQLTDFISPLTPKEKEPTLKLLSLFFYNEEENYNSKEIYYQYLSPILSLLQSLIKESNSSIFPLISNTYSEIVQFFMPTNIESSNTELEINEKRAYEILQGFCIYNMKYDDKSNRICGSLCLTKLVENCPIVLQIQYLKYIWENIITFIDKKNFNAKYELLNCLISLILGSENLFSQFANVTLYKVLDFLTDNDWLKRKLALNVIYTLIFYCKEEILPLKEHIINFLKVLKTDKVKEVREVCLLILQIFNENEDGNIKIKKENLSFQNRKNIKQNKKNDIQKNKNLNKVNSNRSYENQLKQNHQDQNFDNQFFEYDENYNTNPNNFNLKNQEIKNNQTKNRIKSSSSGMKKNPNFNKGNSNFDIVIVEPKKKNNNFENNNINNTNINIINTNNLNLSNIENENKRPKTPTKVSRIRKNSNNENKLVNRREDNSFINEKMIIKRDPNKSIFKQRPNQEFFKNAKNKQLDVIIVAKGVPQSNNNKINNNENNNNENNFNENNFRNNNFENEIQENNFNKKNDYNNNNNENKNDLYYNNSDLNYNYNEDFGNEFDNENKYENKINKNKNEKEEILNEKRDNYIKESPNIKNNYYNKNNKFQNKENNDLQKQRENENETNYISKSKREENDLYNKYLDENNYNSNNENEDLNQNENIKNYSKENINHNNIDNNNNKNIKSNENSFKILNKNINNNYNNNNKIINLNNLQQKNTINNINNNYNNQNITPSLINSLLQQMNSLSQKQLLLVDTLDNIQSETQNQIENLNTKIYNLESKVDDLSSQLNNLRSKNYTENSNDY